jgi:hypothetical protein
VNYTTKMASKSGFEKTHHKYRYNYYIKSRERVDKREKSRKNIAGTGNGSGIGRHK